MESLQPPDTGGGPPHGPAPDARRASRLIVLGHVVHQPPASEPTQVGEPWGVELRGEDPPYVRPRLRVGPRWQRLDLGWLGGNCSLLHLANHATQYQRIPTPEARAADDARVVEVAVLVAANAQGDAYHAPIIEVPPGQDCRFRPAGGVQLFARCRQGTAHVTVSAFPQ